MACLTSIGIKKKFRNKGYAKILIKSTLKLLKKDFDAALLIARRKVNHFYDKFGFRGNSNFCEIKFETHSKKLFKLDSKIDFNITKKNMYSSTHKKNNGYIYRNQEDWDLIKLKIKKNFFKLATIFNSKKKEIGYIIFKNKTIFEYGFNNKYLKEFLNSINFFFSGFVVIKNPTKSVLKYYIKYKEVTVSKRFCNFGGHMIYFFKKKNLSKIMYNINYFDEF